ncbi:hypothetical protein MTZ49_11335 [Entomomonas sp. E2T0]|uniref:hypothetical protein n=1 Tax=Entomomonas sp. E2T0 TaxID=2930213 RepID=UPI00222840A2|nr:hypothetical protein [Entomomonas sp. E2T0]UYZ83190.1 hypothetical protein MTZ49_11335 [Entomomonas sp. E2T0]
MIEILNFILAVLVPAAFTFIGYLLYSKYRDLDRIENLLEKIEKIQDQEEMADTKRYLEKKKIYTIKFLVTGRKTKEQQDMFYKIYEKCGTSFSSTLIRMYTHYTTLSNNRLVFSFFPFLWQSLLATIFMIAFISSAMRFYLPTIKEHEYLYAGSFVFYSLALSFCIISALYYYLTIIFTYKKYKQLIASDYEHQR